MVDDPMIDYNFLCMDKLLEDPDSVPVDETTGLQLLSYLTKCHHQKMRSIVSLVQITKMSSVASTVARAKRNRSKSSGGGYPMATAINKSGRSRTKSRPT
jgi:hypothetical protein